MKPILEVRNLWKEYRIGSKQKRYKSLRDSLSSFFKAKPKSEAFWALQDINFDVYEGDCIGIIGRNGAGKSTLLKILSKITPPTKGYIKTRGRIASLLEVGTGFHPELTGRENIYLNGSILGLRRSEINRKFDEIVDFSGVEQFLDTPLKHYSSGMQLRLAFSVAAHLEPEILLIDEVLAVGDAEFQKKCLGKMDEVSNSGRTIIFVSHNLSAVKKLCPKSLLLFNGKSIHFDDTYKTIQKYLDDTTFIRSRANYQKFLLGTEIVKLEQVECINKNKSNSSNFKINQKIGVKIIYQVLKSNHILHLGIKVYNKDDINIFDSHSVTSNLYTQFHPVGFFESIVWIPSNLLNEGFHSISIAIFNHENHTIHFFVDKCVNFTVQSVLFTPQSPISRGYNMVDFPGLIAPLLKWEITQLKNFSNHDS